MLAGSSITKTEAYRMWAGGNMLAWWWRQLKTTIHSPRHDPGLLPDALIIEVTEFVRKPHKLNGNLLARRNGYEEFIAPLAHGLQVRPRAASRQPVGLRLPAAMTLHRKLIFPAMAERHLHAAIGFEMDRLTPFAPSEVIWSISALTRQRQILNLTLLIVPRTVIEPLLEILHRMTLEPCFVETELGRIGLAQHKARPRHFIRAALQGVCCVATLGIALAPVAQQQRQLNAMDHRLKMLMPEQQQSLLLQSEVAQLQTSQQIIAAGEKTDTLQILATLTKALPDGTWLSGLTMTLSQITLSGHSDNAAKLIPALASSGFRDPSFISAITQASDQRTETFLIQTFISK